LESLQDDPNVTLEESGSRKTGVNLFWMDDNIGGVVTGGGLALPTVPGSHR
jgi:succinyl-CoA synthetase beta subunit